MAQRENLLEAAVAIAGVGVFVAITYVAGVTFDGEGLSETAALTVVGGIVIFILVMAVVGYWLAGR